MDKIGLNHGPAPVPKPQPLVPGRVEPRPAVPDDGQEAVVPGDGAPPEAALDDGAQPAPAVADGAQPASAAPAAAEQPAAAVEERFRSKMVVDVVTGAVLVAVGLGVIVEGVRMGIGWGPDGPEGGFVPFWLAIILTLCSASIVVRGLVRASRERFATREQLSCVLQVMLPATAMIALIPLLGIYFAGALYTVLYMRWGGRHSWALSIALPIVVLLLFFLVFEKWFLVPLPKGPIEAWLGY